MLTYLLTDWTLFDHLVNYNSTSLIRSCLSWVFYANSCYNMIRMHILCVFSSWTPWVGIACSSSQYVVLCFSEAFLSLCLSHSIEGLGSFKVDNYLPLISVLISHLSAKSAISRFNKYSGSKSCPCYALWGVRPIGKSSCTEDGMLASQ